MHAQEIERCLASATTVLGATVASRQFDEATSDTFTYVGDLTAERVARYADAIPATPISELRSQI